jgi:hypothetical protein
VSVRVRVDVQPNETVGHGHEEVIILLSARRFVRALEHSDVAEHRAEDRLGKLRDEQRDRAAQQPPTLR